ncbi:chitin deacetylase 1 [Battus philenor]|uniref:chitin deacetylase 1 n=1 Tax=Battus philenor TaxID=42288 RepID=UPI0035CE9E92
MVKGAISILRGSNFARSAMATYARIVLLCAIFVYVNCQKVKEEEEFVCPEGTTGNGNFADPATCRRFYQCVDGYPYLNRCPSGLYFDDISKYCTFKAEARCGPISTTPAPITEAPTDLATKCDPAECQLPYCFCSKDGTIIPGGLEPQNTPQIIMLTFDGAVNLNNYDLYRKVFNGKIRNPNGCPIRGTFFLSHEYSNYVMVQSLAHDGHEIATGTISQQQGLQDKGYEEWAGEMIGMREILKKFANISRTEIVGARAPFLKPGRNTQFKVLEDFGYIYDSSVGVPPLPIPVWPYTLDYKIAHECKSGTCPTKSFPGLWEVPFNAHYVESFEGGHCPYLDQCVLHNHDSDEVLEWLQEDFNRHYEQNRAPYMMPFHTNWFQIKELEHGLHKFLRWAADLNDVWFVTVTQALTWITDPKPAKALNNYEPWRCDKRDLPSAPCNLSNKCALSFKHPETNFTDTRYMETCTECPHQYPWLGDSGGTGIVGKDNYIPDNLKRK